MLLTKLPAFPNDFLPFRNEGQWPYFFPYTKGVENSYFECRGGVRTCITATEMAELGRIAGLLEGKEFVEAFQPSAKHNEWCLRFDVAEIGISIRPGEYDSSERIVEEVRRQLALVTATGILRSNDGFAAKQPSRSTRAAEVPQ